MVAKSPSGLIRGPARTRATKPYVSGTSTQPHPSTATASAMRTAPVATVRAATSFTGFGNEKKEERESSLAMAST